MSLLAVETAKERVVANVQPVESERVSLQDAHGRVLADPVFAKRTQPPFPASAMDGYAVRASDFNGVGPGPKVVGASAAGHGYRFPLDPGQAIRIFTGAPVPKGADSILIQENATVVDGEYLEATDVAPPGKFIRPAGLDFTDGDVLIHAGRQLDGRALSVAAAANVTEFSVRRRPRVAVLATGDELVAPGTEPGPDQIVASNQIGLAAEIQRSGGETIDLGISPDDRAEIANRIAKGIARDADVIVTLGGASVGEHDLVAASLGDAGMSLGFWKIAMRPGKPLMFGTIGQTRVLGLPGNPVSSLVCSVLFLRPLLFALLGRTEIPDVEMPAILASDLPKNDQRQDYLRAVVQQNSSGQFVARPFSRQDSSMLSVHSRANALIVRAPFAAPAFAGSPCRVILLD